MDHLYVNSFNYNIHQKYQYALELLFKTSVTLLCYFNEYLSLLDLRSDTVFLKHLGNLEEEEKPKISFPDTEMAHVPFLTPKDF